MIVLVNHTSGFINVVYTEYTFYCEILINISGNIGPKITASSRMQSLTTMIVQIDNGEL